MSQYLNQAALDYWSDLDDKIDPILRKKFVDSFGDDKKLDAMIDQMIVVNLAINDDLHLQDATENICSKVC